MWYIYILGIRLLCSLFYPTTAYAEEATVTAPAIADPVEERLESIDQHISDGFRDLQQTLQDQHLQEEQQQELDRIDNDSSRELDLISNIDTNVSRIVEDGDSSVPESEPVLTRDNLHTFVCYGHSPTSNNYYQYALGLMPKVGWNDHYCFIQDTQGSYVFTYGDLVSDGSGTITGSDCTWHRWYNGGMNVGWVHETGSGGVSITTQGYTIYSDLDWYPTIPSDEILRREVMWYAVVGVAVVSLHLVWSYCLRNRNGTT